jgi:hypothetical protein
MGAKSVGGIIKIMLMHSIRCGTSSRSKKMGTKRKLVRVDLHFMADEESLLLNLGANAFSLTLGDDGIDSRMHNLLHTPITSNC